MLRQARPIVTDLYDHARSLTPAVKTQRRRRRPLDRVQRIGNQVHHHLFQAVGIAQGRHLFRLDLGRHGHVRATQTLVEQEQRIVDGAPHVDRTRRARGFAGEGLELVGEGAQSVDNAADAVEIAFGSRDVAATEEFDRIAGKRTQRRQRLVYLMGEARGYSSMKDKTVSGRMHG